jgi:hypothetical protein
VVLSFVPGLTLKLLTADAALARYGDLVLLV